jgi:hypothetical protein
VITNYTKETIKAIARDDRTDAMEETLFLFYISDFKLQDTDDWIFGKRESSWLVRNSSLVGQHTAVRVCWIGEPVAGVGVTSICALVFR